MKGAKVSDYYYYYFLTLTQNDDREVLPAMSEVKNLMHAQRPGAIVVEKAVYQRVADSEASEEAEVRADAGDLGSKEAQSVHES